MRPIFLIFLSLILATAIVLIFNYDKFPAYPTTVYISKFIGTHPEESKEYIPANEKSTGNVPFTYFDKLQHKPKEVNATCAKYPEFFSLRFKNNYWQMLETSNGTVHLFNAYFDHRINSIRLMATYDVYRTESHFFCQFWYENNSKPSIVESGTPFWLFLKDWGADKGYFHHPYIITCPLDGRSIPQTVSLVEDKCDNATNNLVVVSKQLDNKKNFVVCVKGLNFPFDDQSRRLTEWIELVRLLGAEKINFYKFSVHPNAERVLDFYADEGFVEVTPITLVDDVSNRPFLQSYYLRHGKMLTAKRLQEVITYNDCLYKHLEQFKYVVLLDTDEIIVPVENTWIELIQELNVRFANKSSFMSRNVYFFDVDQHQHDWFGGIPTYMHMLQHVYRAVNYTKVGAFEKGFHDTNKVSALHNHYPFQCLHKCRNQEIGVELAQLQHYRADCAAGVGKVCKDMKENSVLDDRVWRFKEELVRRVDQTLRELDLPNL